MAGHNLKSTFVIAITFASNFLVTYSEMSENNLFKQMIQIAVDIESSIKNSSIYYVGQSPIWLGTTLDLMNSSTRTGNVNSYVPFSGKCLEFVENKEEEFGYYTSENANMPSAKNLELYRSLLRNLELDPKSILERYRNFGRETVLMDFIEEGRSLASFLYILYEWAAEENVDLTDALEVVIL